MKLIEIKNEIALIEFKNYFDEEQTKIKNHHHYYVKEQYIKDYPNFENLNSMEVFKHTDIQKYFHRLDGPAVIDLINNLSTHFIDGKLIVEKEN